MEEEVFIKTAIAAARKKRYRLDSNRKTILILRFLKDYTIDEICRFFGDLGMECKYSTLSSYLRKRPPSKDELNNLKAMISADVGERSFNPVPDKKNETKPEAKPENKKENDPSTLLKEIRSTPRKTLLEIHRERRMKKREEAENN